MRDVGRAEVLPALRYPSAPAHPSVSAPAPSLVLCWILCQVSLYCQVPALFPKLWAQHRPQELHHTVHECKLRYRW